MSGRTNIALIALAWLYLAWMITASQLNTDFGRLKVEKISIPAEDYALSGLLYIPPEAHPDNPRPGVVLAHGISSSKETMSGIALELARRGAVALTIDLAGHGESGGGIGSGDPSFGVIDSVCFLREQDYVDRGLIGLVGHSLGAGASRRAAVEDGGIAAAAFIGGGVGGMSEGPEYGVLNSSFPRNLLVAVGRQDVLFDLEGLESDLRPVFDASEPIVPGRVYGGFSTRSARKLVTPSTIHLLEPLDPLVVSEVAAWMVEAFDSPSGRSLPPSDLLYVYIELSLTAALIAFVFMVFPLSKIFVGKLSLSPGLLRGMVSVGRLTDLGALLVWGGLGMGLYLPLMGLGAAIPFPPLIFGSSMAWWMLAVGLSGLLVLRLLPQRLSVDRFRVGVALSEAFTLRDIALGAGMFLFLYLAAVSVEAFSSVNLRIVVPLFRALSPARIVVLPTFLPFFLAYFFSEGLYLHRLRAVGRYRGLVGLLRTVGLKTAPYLAVLAIQYAPIFLLDLRAFPGLLGFFIEFVWAMVPLFVISTVASWRLYGLTSRIGAGVVFNALLFAWISAALFPFGSFA